MAAGSTWLVWAMLAGGGASHVQGAAVMGSLAAERPLGSWVAFEGDVGAGGMGPQHPLVRPYLWIAGAHMHEVLYDDVRHHLAGVLSASETAGVHHRTGAEAGLGLEWPALLGATTGVSFIDRMESQARISVIAMPGLEKSPTREYVMGELSLGYRF